MTENGRRESTRELHFWVISRNIRVKKEVRLSPLAESRRENMKTKRLPMVFFR